MSYGSDAMKNLRHKAKAMETAGKIQASKNVFFKAKEDE